MHDTIFFFTESKSIILRELTLTFTFPTNTVEKGNLAAHFNAVLQKI